MEHADYPHEPGRLYDCPACESGPCACTDDDAPCVSVNCTYQGECEHCGGPTVSDNRYCSDRCFDAENSPYSVTTIPHSPSADAIARRWS